MRWGAAAAAALAWSAAAAAHGGVAVGARADFDAGLLRIEEQRSLGRAVPDVAVHTESGVAHLRDLAAGQPLVVLLGYFGCDGVCPAMLRELADALRTVRSPAHRVAVLSFDPADTLESLRRTRSELGGAPPGWTFGLLEREAAQQLTRAVGYRYFFSERDHAYVHPAALVFLSPTGTVARYLYGPGLRQRDIELALLEARAGTARANDLLDAARLLCYRYDPARSRYVVHPALFFGGAGLGLLALTAVLALTFRRRLHGAQS